MFRVLIAFSVVSSALLASVAVQAKPAAVKDPMASMRALYAGLEKDDFNGDLPMSQRLRALMLLDTRETGKGEVGRIDFDYFVNGQDSKVSHVQLTSRDVDNAPGRRIVVVRFMNFDKQMENHYFWEKTKNGWVLDDVRGIDGEGGFVLSLLLKYGWDGPESEKQK